jgi:hypothetical protein
MTALRQALLVLDPAIPLISVCGEGQPWRAEQPPPAEGAAAASVDGGDDVGVHERAFGADRFGFWCAGVRCVVLNSALLCGGGGEGGGGGGGGGGADDGDEAAAASAAAAEVEAEDREDQEQWLEQCLDESKLNAHYSLVFAHRPWFSRSFDEEDGAGGVANVPKRPRVEWLKKFRECNVEAILTGTTAVEGGREVAGAEAGAAAAAGSLSVPEMVPMEGNLVDLAGLNGEAAKKKAAKAVAAAAAGEDGGGSGSGDDDGEDEFRPPRGREGLVPGHGIQSLPTAPYLSGGGGGLVRIVRVLEEGVRSEVYATDALPEEVSLPKTNHAQDFHETSQ